MLCWYYSGTPRLMLRPAKFERVFVKPEIILMRKILTESEMNKIKELASPRVMYKLFIVLFLELILILVA